MKTNKRYRQVTERILQKADKSTFESGVKRLTRDELYER